MAERTNIDTEQEAFEMFASVYPHEAYEIWGERFWNYFHKKLPNISRVEMERLLRETEEG